MAATVNTVWYINYGNGSSTGYYALAKWATGTVYAVGNIVRQNATPSLTNERCFICTVAGTSGGSEPSWTLTQGAKTTDNTVTWQECSGKAAVNGDQTNPPLSSGQRSQSVALGSIIQNNAATFLFICSTAGTAGSGEPSYSTTTGATTSDSGVTWTCIGAAGSFGKWAAPIVRMASSWSATATGDTNYVSSIHAESIGSFNSIVFPSYTTVLTKFVCTNQTGNIPPQSTDLTTGASATSTQNTININGVQAYFYGISFTSSTSYILIGDVSGDFVYFQNCALNCIGNGGGPVYIGYTGGRSVVILQNTTVEISNSSSFLTWGGNVFWRDTPSALSKAGGGSWPTTLFQSTSGTTIEQPTMFIEGVDLSAFAGTQYFGAGLSGRMVMNKCKLASVPTCLISGINNGLCSGTVDLIDCDSGGNTYRHERWSYPGNQAVSTTAVYTGGATNGTTSYSWNVLPSSNAQWLTPYECLPMAIWNTVTGSNVTVTVQGIYNGTALPNNDEIWLDVEYFGTSSSTLSTRVTETKANFLATGSALTANTSAAWNSAATARANTTSYSVGDLISVSTAATGQLYICTSAGTSAGSVPGGYASCADGSSVTDSGATFRAMVRFKMSVVLTSPTPQSAGYLNCYVKAAKASAQYWVDPNPTLS